MQFCHSACNQCTNKLLANQCNSCSSSFLTYTTPTPAVGSPGSCLMSTTNNAQFLLTIDKQTVLGVSNTKSVLFNGNNVSTSGTVLSSLLYSQNVIEFMTLSSNTVEFYISNLPLHKQIIVRARVFTECTSPKNNSVVLSVSPSTNSSYIPSTKTLTQGIEDIIENYASHSSMTDLKINIKFGTQG
jgi:hypothetical protein